MLLSELHAYYGTWTLLARELELGNSTYQTWRKQGYIPFKAQLLIENKTKGLFKACEEQGKPVVSKIGGTLSVKKQEDR